MYLDGFDSLPQPKEKEVPQAPLFLLEQGTGIEPASEAWEATIIADIRTLHGVGIIAKRHGKFNHFLSAEKRGGNPASFLIPLLKFDVWALRLRTVP